MTSNSRVQAPPAGGASYFQSAQWEGLLAFANLLVNEGEKRGLVGPRELERLWDRHILNSMAVLPDIPECDARHMCDAPVITLADIGTGAGFPGIVLAIMRPDVSITLIETMERRVQWLKEVCETLSLNNVTVQRARAEDYAGKRCFDVVTARAVAPMKKLLLLTMPLVKPDGVFLALKGQRAEQELYEAKSVLKKFSLADVHVHNRRVWGTDESTRVVEIRLAQ